MLEDLADYPVIIDEKVVWGEMDAFQHVNNIVYFRYFESARMAYYERIGAMDYFKSNNVGPILASTSCNFRAPLTYPDNIKIAVKVDQIWEKRFNMKIVVYSENLDQIAAEGDAMTVYVDYGAGKSCPISESILASIKQLEKID